MTVINLYGGPGTGKSVLAAELFATMKKKGISVELVTEKAKSLTYSKDYKTLHDQLLVFATQHHKVFKLVGQVDYAIVDSPLLLNLVYFKDDLPYDYNLFSRLVLQVDSHYRTHNFYLERSEDFVYQEYGRNESSKEALEKDDEILETLIAYGIKHSVVDYKNASSCIMKRVGL